MGKYEFTPGWDDSPISKFLIQNKNKNTRIKVSKKSSPWNRNFCEISASFDN